MKFNTLFFVVITLELTKDHQSAPPKLTIVYFSIQSHHSDSQLQVTVLDRYVYTTFMQSVYIINNYTTLLPLHGC